MLLSLMKYGVWFLYFLSLIFCLSSKSYFFIWVCLEFNLLMFVMLLLKFNSVNSNFMINYFIIQGISSSMFLFFLIVNYYNNYFNLSNIFIFILMWMKLGFYPFSSWFFQISENLNWLMWFLLNTFQKLLPFWLISFNFMNFSYMFYMIYINSLYSWMEIWNQISIRWMMNSSSLNHFSWMMLSLNSEKLIWDLYFFNYLFYMFIFMMFAQIYNWNSLLSLISYKSLMINLFFSFLMLNFLGMPPFLGFFWKLMVILNNFSLFSCLILLVNNIIIASVYFYYTVPMMTKNINEKQMMISIKFMMMNLITFVIFFMILFIFL